MIRPVRPEDIDAMIALYRQSVRCVASRDYTPAQVAAWAPDIIDPTPWRQAYVTRTAWVAVIDGEIAGFTDLEDDGHIDKLFVHPDHQRQGIARALITAAETTARHRDMARLFTEASLTARPFFESAGFTVITPQTVHVRGQDFINFRMAKPLS